MTQSGGSPKKNKRDSNKVETIGDILLISAVFFPLPFFYMHNNTLLSMAVFIEAILGISGLILVFSPIISRIVTMTRKKDRS